MAPPPTSGDGSSAARATTSFVDDDPAREATRRRATRCVRRKRTFVARARETRADASDRAARGDRQIDALV